MDGLIAYALAKKYTDKTAQLIINAGFKVQVEPDRSILNTIGQEKILYLLPKISSNQNDGYDEYVYANNHWECVGHTDVDLSAYYTKAEIDNKRYLTEHQDISGKENTSNKVTSISDQSTDDQYPTAKCVYDAIESAIASQATDLSSATVTLSVSSFTYDGTSKVPSVTSVVLDGQTLTSGTDYAVVSSPATNAGSYTLTVNGIGDYKGTIIVNWTINKAQATISGASTINITGLNESKSETYTTTGDGNMSFSISDSSIASISNSSGQVTVTSVAEGNTTLTITVADGTNYLGTTKSVTITIQEILNTVFGVMWDYSLSSPVLTRLTTLTDPLEVVTDCPTTEPTACIGSIGGSSEFDNYLPWSGMIRKNYANGELVDFTGYDNGETYVFIPEFWSKIVDDSEHSKMYIYISSRALTGFTKHPGSGRYVGRYQCNTNMKSETGGTLRTSATLNDVRNAIVQASNHYVFDVHTYMALVLLYTVEFASLDSQTMIGAGISSGSSVSTGQTDVLTHHTGRVSGETESLCAIHYRWVENIYGNVNDFIDGVIVENSVVKLCSSPSDYAQSNAYVSTEINVPAWTSQAFITALTAYGNCYLFPKTLGGSDTTYLCDSYYSESGTNCVFVGSAYGGGTKAGIFYWNSGSASNAQSANNGSRPIIIPGGDAQ